MSSTVPPPFTLDGGTLFSLAVAFSLMPAAQALAAFALPKNTSRKYYLLFLWHAYDFLTHFIVEGAYLYHSLFSYIEVSITSDYPHPASRGQHVGPYLYNRSDRRYGSIYATAPMARLWQEYAKADSRWGGADLTVISIELLTVGLAGPAATYICFQISKLLNTANEASRGQIKAQLWFVAIILATGELYGGFMTFSPEWLSGNNALAGDDPVYLWLYLVFFNMLWVIVPLGVLYLSYQELSSAFKTTATGTKKKL